MSVRQIPLNVGGRVRISRTRAAQAAVNGGGRAAYRRTRCLGISGCLQLSLLRRLYAGRGAEGAACLPTPNSYGGLRTATRKHSMPCTPAREDRVFDRCRDDAFGRGCARSYAGCLLAGASGRSRSTRTRGVRRVATTDHGSAVPSISATSRPRGESGGGRPGRGRPSAARRPSGGAGR